MLFYCTYIYFVIESSETFSLATDEDCS